MAKRIYIAGPMTGLPDFNYPLFNETAAQLRACGWEVCNPAENFMGRTDLPYATYIREGIRQLLDCDAIYLLDDWSKSRGASIEWLVADRLGLDQYSETSASHRGLPTPETAPHLPPLRSAAS